MPFESIPVESDAAIHGSIVEEITLVKRIVRTELISFTASSLPGHLIHLVESGRVEQVALGRRQEITAGGIVWYHENESIEGRVCEVPWTFYTVNFYAPTLPPPPHECRVFHHPEAISLGKALYEAWNDFDVSPMMRHLRVHARLLELLMKIYPEASSQQRIDRSASLWWQIEEQLRRDLSQPIDLHRIERIAGYTSRQINQSCRAACGMTPMRRVKEIRLDYARGLVFFSNQSFSEIALQIGYPRVQEFSRDYHQRFGHTPTEDREKGPEL